MIFTYYSCNTYELHIIPIFTNIGAFGMILLSIIDSQIYPNSGINHTLNYPGTGTSLVVQWLRLHAPNAGGPGSIPGQGTRSLMPQLKIPHASKKFSHAATKTRCNQIKKKLIILA